jgi:hypothetical protein
MNSLDIYYRPDNYPEWIPWRQFSSDDLKMIGKPGAIDGGGVPSAKAGFIPRLSFGKPMDASDPTTSRKTRRAYQFQVRFVGTGHMVIDRFRIHGQRLIEKSRAKQTP